MSRTNIVTQHIIKYLNYSGFKAWRNNNGAVYSLKRKSFLKNPTHLLGVTDVVGFRKSDGKALFVEIKTGRDKLSYEQIQFLEHAKKAGCIAFKASTIQDVEEELKYYKIKEVNNAALSNKLLNRSIGMTFNQLTQKEKAEAEAYKRHTYKKE